MASKIMKIKLLDELCPSNLPNVRTLYICLFVCLFVCLWLFVPLENFSLIYRRHHYRWRAANFQLCSALMAIEQWGFYSVPHLLWHGTFVFNGHLRGPVTFTLIAERLAVGLSLPVFFRLRSVAAGIRTSNLPLEGRTLSRLHNNEVHEDKIASSDTTINIIG